MDDNIKVASGFIIAELDEEEKNVELKSEDCMILKSEEIYQLLSGRDYNYS